MFAKFLGLLKTQIAVVGLVGLIAGAIIILAIRLMTYSKDNVHYHANFAIYINGEREQFKSANYYEEESGSGSCAEEESITPLERAHLHNRQNSVVHVEDHAVTWGHFFQNLGWQVSPKLIQARNNLFVAGNDRKVSFVLNGQPAANPMNQIVGNLDRLLVDFGKTNRGQLAKEFRSVPATAEAENQEQDPASCGGSAPTTFSDRWRHLF